MPDMTDTPRSSSLPADGPAPGGPGALLAPPSEVAWPTGWVHRPVQASDLASLHELESRAFPFPWTLGNLRDALNCGYRMELLQDGQGQLKGHMVVMPGVDELHLLDVAVAPECQGQGLGRAWMQRLRECAIHAAAAQVWLEVRRSNAPALKLYERTGFAHQGVRKGYYPAAGGREDALVMSWAIDNPPQEQAT